MTDQKFIEVFEVACPYVLTSMFSVAVVLGMVVGIQRGLNAQARITCLNKDYAKLVSFRSAAGAAVVCMPAPYLNSSKSLPD